METTFNIIDTKSHRVIIADIRYYSNVKAILKSLNVNNSRRYSCTIVRKDKDGNIIKNSDWDI